MNEPRPEQRHNDQVTTERHCNACSREAQSRGPSARVSRVGCPQAVDKISQKLSTCVDRSSSVCEYLCMEMSGTLPTGTVVNYRGSARHGRYVIMGVQNTPAGPRYWIESIVSQGVYSSGANLTNRRPVDLSGVSPTSVTPIWRNGQFVTMRLEDRF